MCWLVKARSLLKETLRMLYSERLAIYCTEKVRRRLTVLFIKESRAVHCWVIEYNNVLDNLTKFICEYAEACMAVGNRMTLYVPILSCIVYWLLYWVYSMVNFHKTARHIRCIHWQFMRAKLLMNLPFRHQNCRPKGLSVPFLSTINFNYFHEFAQFSNKPAAGFW